MKEIGVVCQQYQSRKSPPTYRQRIGDISQFSVKIDPLFFDNQRALLHLGMNGADIFADNADENQLDGGKEKQTDDQRRHAHLKVFPEN